MERSALVSMLVCVLLVLAGCSGAEHASSTTSHTAPSGSVTTSQSASSTSTSTSREETSQGPTTPFGKTNLSVGIQNFGEPGRNFTPQLTQALHYWNEHQEYGNYTAQYHLNATTDHPDIRIQIVSEIPTCGSESDVNHTIGCAPILGKYQTAIGVQIVRVKAGMSNKTTVHTMEHELGHTRGLEHGMQPMPLMAATTVNFTTEPKPDARNTTHPWGGRKTLNVYVDNTDTMVAAKSRIRKTLGFYESGANGWVPKEEEYKYNFVDSPKKAQIVIKIRGGRASYMHGSKSIDGGSVAVVRGLDPDGDTRFEQYTQLRITVSGIGDQRLPWHIGYWLALAYGGTSTKRPRHLRDGSSRTYAFWLH